MSKPGPKPGTHRKYDHKQIKKWLLSGMSCKEVARRTGARSAYISTLRKRNGWYPPGYTIPRKINTDHARDEIRKLAEQGIPAAEIARKLGYNERSVAKTIQEKAWANLDRRKARRKYDYEQIEKLVQQGYTASAIAGIVGGNAKHIGNLISKHGWKRVDSAVGNDNKQVRVMRRRVNVLDHMDKIMAAADDMLEEARRKDDFMQKLYVIREMRKQLLACIRVEEMYLAMKDVREFQAIVLEVLKKASPKVRDEVYRLLSHKRAVGMIERIKRGS